MNKKGAAITKPLRIFGGPLTEENERRRIAKNPNCDQCGCVLGEYMLHGVAKDNKNHSFCSLHCLDAFNDSIASK